MGKGGPTCTEDGRKQKQQLLWDTYAQVCGLGLPHLIPVIIVMRWGAHHGRNE